MGLVYHWKNVLRLNDDYLKLSADGQGIVIILLVIYGLMNAFIWAVILMRHRRSALPHQQLVGTS
jgi:hypothetical protein